MLTRNRTRPAPKISTPYYTGTEGSHSPTSSQSHRPIIPLPIGPNGDRTGTLRVRAFPRVGSGRVETDRGYTRAHSLPIRLPLSPLGKGIIDLWLWLDVKLWESPVPM